MHALFTCKFWYIYQSPDISNKVMNNCTVKLYIFTFWSVIEMNEIILTWGLVIVAIINISLGKNWN